ncbi:MAG TPA: alkaline phosphatase family protein, partial [Novosphingobium sp.]|nr:alkaline phosphatase family protein [Novosphingobium sp.]
LAEPGWSILPSAPREAFTGGAHGSDPAVPDMAALFIGHGPSFAPGIRLVPFDNVAITPLLRHLLGLPPAAHLDGSTAPFTRVLRP